jgi:hypothetical protein
MKKKIGFLVALSYSCILFAANETITLKSIELTMPELLKEAERQTGMTLDLQVRESKAVKMFYDCTIGLNDLLKAVKGYYKSQADLDLIVLKTKKGYWLGIREELYKAPPEIEEPKKEVKKPEVANEPQPVTKRKNVSNDIKKTGKRAIKNVGRAVSKSKDSVRNLFSRFKNKFNKKQKKDTSSKTKGSNDIIKSLNLNSKNKSAYDSSNIKMGNESFDMIPKKATYEPSHVIDVELNKSKKEDKPKIQPNSLENLEMEL